MRLFATIVATLIVAAVPLAASAQQDMTPPTLLNFTVSPTVFDAGVGPVSIER
jgi:hypothetical protein